MVTVKDTLRLFAISVVICCAAFVCTMFLNYRIDLTDIKDTVTGEQAVKLYDAQMSTSTVVCGAAGGCLIITSVVMLLTYIKNFISTRSKELGIMKALGYSDMSISKHFRIFGLSVFAGALVGVCAAVAYLPRFYELQDKGIYYSVERHSHFILWALLIILPTALFAVISVYFAYRRLKKPVMGLLRESADTKLRKAKESKTSLPFLKELRRDTVRSKRSLIFFIWFSAFCFGSNVQMSFSMTDLANETMGVIILVIGLILAYMMLILALSAVVKGSSKTVAMMRVFGYDDSDTAKAVLGGYRPIALLGFIVGTLYQFGLLNVMVNIVFKDIDDISGYSFDFKALCIALPTFVISYELIMLFFQRRITKLPIKSIMLES